jgi:hypothetical protein
MRIFAKFCAGEDIAQGLWSVERKRRLHSATLWGKRCPQGLKPIVLFPVCTG